MATAMATVATAFRRRAREHRHAGEGGQIDHAGVKPARS
jgi:hypothetical protein